MKANCWMGRNTVEVQDVADPSILSARDAIVKVTSTAICGSDLHLVDGYVQSMEKGDILGHEFMGEVVEVGRGISGDMLRRRPRGRAVPDRLWRVQRLSGRAVLLLREQQPQRLDGWVSPNLERTDVLPLASAARRSVRLRNECRPAPAAATPAAAPSGSRTAPARIA